MPRYAPLLVSLLILLAACVLLQTADAAKPEVDTGKAKTKKDRDDALDSMSQGKPNKDAAGFYKGGDTSKRQKFAETMNQLSSNLGKLHVTRHYTWWSLSAFGIRDQIGSATCQVLCSQTRPAHYAAVAMTNIYIPKLFYTAIVLDLHFHVQAL